MIISNTEVTSYNLCKRQHYYRFRRELEPRPQQLSFALYRGLIGHLALEAYYLEMKAGLPVETCRKTALNVIDREISWVVANWPEDFDRVQLLIKLKALIEAYSEFYRQEPFHIVAVEKVYTAPVDQIHDIRYGMKLDLLVEYIKGPFKGDLVIVDHKFVYNFKSQAELEMDGQIPKYIKTVRYNDLYVSKGIFNQLRHRNMKNPKPEDIFNRTSPIKPTETESLTIWEEQTETAIEIATKNIPPRRTLSPIVCRGCYFQPLCRAELVGQNVTNMIEISYQNSTYGYSDLLEGDS